MTVEPSAPRNCFTCNHCVKNGSEFTCRFKAVNMGATPYYPKQIPADHLTYHGFVVCDYQPKPKNASARLRTLHDFLS